MNWWWLISLWGGNSVVTLHTSLLHRLSSTAPMTAFRKKDKHEKEDAAQDRVPQGQYWVLFLFFFFKFKKKNPCMSETLPPWRVLFSCCLIVAVWFVRWPSAKTEHSSPGSRGHPGQVQEHQEDQPEWWSHRRSLLWWIRRSAEKTDTCVQGTWCL